MSQPLLSPPKYFPLELFVNNEFVEENDLECSICANVNNDPHQCRNGHSFCRDCLVKSLSKQEVCPECREKTTLQTMSSNRMAKNMIDRADVYCFTHLEALQNSADENDEAAGSKRKRSSKATKKLDYCKWTGKLCDASAHFDECEHAGSTCENDGCPVVVKRKDMDQHEASCPYRTQPCAWCHKHFLIAGRRGSKISISDHESICPKREVNCTHTHLGCKAVMCADMLEEHLADDCMYETVACPFSTVGCDEWMMRKDIDSHEEAAAKQHNRLMLKDIQSLRTTVEEQEEKAVEQDETIQSLLKKTTEQESPLHVITFCVHVMELLSYSDRVTRVSNWLLAERYSASVEVDKGHNSDCCGVYLRLMDGPFPCRVTCSFEVVHWDGNSASICKREKSIPYGNAAARGINRMIALDALNDAMSPYVNNYQVTFIARFRILPVE